MFLFCGIACFILVLFVGTGSTCSQGWPWTPDSLLFTSGVLYRNACSVIPACFFWVFFVCLLVCFFVFIEWSWSVELLSNPPVIKWQKRLGRAMLNSSSLRSCWPHASWDFTCFRGLYFSNWGKVHRQWLCQGCSWWRRPEQSNCHSSEWRTPFQGPWRD